MNVKYKLTFSSSHNSIPVSIEKKHYEKITEKQSIYIMAIAINITTIDCSGDKSTCQLTVYDEKPR